MEQGRLAKTAFSCIAPAMAAKVDFYVLGSAAREQRCMLAVSRRSRRLVPVATRPRAVGVAKTLRFDGRCDHARSYFPRR